MEARRIERWLLDAGAQQRTGEHRGGVAGWTGPDDRALYVYPEITGYYLQWLAWIACRRLGDPAPGLHAAAAQRWLAAWAGEVDPPRTRVYLQGSLDDWRNGAVFCFDLAMALRGIASAHREGLIVADAVLVERLCGWLSRLVGADGEFEACLRHRASAAFPERWSTRRGAFLAKAAAGILIAGATLPAVPRDLQDAAERSLVASLAALVHAPHDETHPFLYAVEGYLSLPQRPDFASRLPAIAAVLDARMEEAERLGRVPEMRGGGGQPRLDVVAQALRAGLLLDAHRAPAQAGVGRHAFLADVLARHVAPGGALPFAAGAEGVQHNVWTAMFAEQALALYDCAPAERLRFAGTPSIV
jgi:hypothetical protein